MCGPKLSARNVKLTITAPIRPTANRLFQIKHRYQLLVMSPHYIMHCHKSKLELIHTNCN